MATKKQAAGKTAKNVSDNGAKFAAVFNKCKTEAEGKKILDYMVSGFTMAYEEFVASLAPKSKSGKGKATKETAKSKATKAEAETVTVAEGDKKALKALNLEFHDYSEKSFAITGDTKPVREICKRLGGRFNAWLTVGAGWVFPKKKEAEVKAALCIK